MTRTLRTAPLITALGLGATGCSDDSQPSTPDSTVPDVGGDKDKTPPPDGPAVDTSICGPGATLCGGVCVNLKSDNVNCGACAKACKAGEVCAAGACALSCPAGQKKCTGGDGGAAFCAKLSTDTQNCGACGTACAAGQVCTAGVCGFACPPGQKKCSGGDAGAPFCATLASDVNNCGACGKACGAGQVCTAGVCTLSCPTGQQKCSAGDAGAPFCAKLQTDAKNCGACGNACGLSQVCVAGGCTLSCPPGQQKCGGGDANAAWAKANGVAYDYAIFLRTAQVPSSCAELKLTGTKKSGVYTIDPNGGSPKDAFSVYCDMTTDGGGWTIVYAATGADGEQPMVSDKAVAGDPLTFKHHNLDRARKMALSAISTESLFRRKDGAWLKTNHALFDSKLATKSSHAHYSVTLTASNKSSAKGWMGWSTYNITHGGDYNLSTSKVNNGVDHHSSSYYHLNGGCVAHYLYSYSYTKGDGDAGYDVNTALGSWTATQSCDAAEGGKLAFYAAMR